MLLRRFEYLPLIKRRGNSEKRKEKRNYDNVRNCFIPYCSVVVVFVVVVSVVVSVVDVVVSSCY